MLGNNINIGCIPTQFIILDVDKRSSGTAVTNIQHNTSSQMENQQLGIF